MKILHVIPSIALVRGGPSQAILETITALNNLGIEAEIVTTNDNGDTLLDVPLKQKIIYQGVPVWFFPRFSPRISAIREFAVSASLTAWLWNNISNYDLLHIHAIFSYPSTIAMAIARIKKVPYICRPLGQLCNWSLQQGEKKKKFYLDLVERTNLNQAQALHFTSDPEQQEAAILNLKSNSFVLPHGLTVSPLIFNAKQKLRQQYNLLDNEPIILFLSRIHPKKGLDYLIPALGKLTNQSFTFILAGNGEAEYEQEITQLLEQHNLKERTLQVGFVQGEEKNLLLQGSDLFTLTSYSENFGVAVLEALAAATPALVTPGVALASMLKQNRIGYITDLDVEQISKSIEYCLEHQTELTTIGEQARNFILQNYTWDSIAKNLISNYQKILQNQIITLNEYSTINQ
jgi:glycosyltransferase involved in cell wall biosynthesis